MDHTHWIGELSASGMSPVGPDALTSLEDWSSERSNSRGGNLCVYPHNEHRVVWATRRFDNWKLLNARGSPFSPGVELTQTSRRTSLYL